MTTTTTTPAKATTADRILDVFRDLPTARVAQIVEVTGLGRSTVQDNLKKLANSGDVIRMDITQQVGTSSKPVATWQLTPARKAANKKATAKLAAAAKKAEKKAAAPAKSTEPRRPATVTVHTSDTKLTPTGRRAKGVLDQEIVDFMSTRPTDDMGPYQVAVAVGAKTGAVHPALERLLAKGLVEKTSEVRPVRYRYTLQSVVRTAA